MSKDSAPQNVTSVLKWVTLLFAVLVAGFVAWLVYAMVYKPAKSVTDGTGKVIETVSDGAGNVKDGAQNMLGRLNIATAEQDALNTLSNAAFPVLESTSVTAAEGVKDRVFRSANFGDSQGRICRFSVDFGQGALPVMAAADIDGYATAKALGSTDNRLIRVAILTEGDDVLFNVVWDKAEQNWQLKWKPTMVTKPIEDSLVDIRAREILELIPENCAP